jgi:hypothetical protein
MRIEQEQKKRIIEQKLENRRTEIEQEQIRDRAGANKR